MAPAYVRLPHLTVREIAALVKAANRGLPLPIAVESRSATRAVVKLERALDAERARAEWAL